ncbi:hypothetical protein Golomagni_05706 [Golovinomyces magnicellulatus]|nr:hypothetical protein Golomagni_05706 [Golovinomyces magnicellulatus]
MLFRHGYFAGAASFIAVVSRSLAPSTARTTWTFPTTVEAVIVRPHIHRVRLPAQRRSLASSSDFDAWMAGCRWLQHLVLRLSFKLLTLLYSLCLSLRSGALIDKKCPWTGLVSIRGRILTGKVVSTKMTRTIIIRREYLHFVPKYSRYEKRHKNLACHVSPAFRVEEGDQVTVGQCRPLSKTVRFNVLRVLPRTGKAVKKFSKF